MHTESEVYSLKHSCTITGLQTKEIKNKYSVLHCNTSNHLHVYKCTFQLWQLS